MNKRQRKKKLKNIFNDIKVLKLKEGDLLVFRVDTTKVPYPLVARYIEHIREKITTNIVVIPTKTDLYIQNNSVTRTLMDYIEKRGQEIAKLKEELAKLETQLYKVSFLFSLGRLSTYFLNSLVIFLYI